MSIKIRNSSGEWVRVSGASDGISDVTIENNSDNKIIMATDNPSIIKASSSYSSNLSFANSSLSITNYIKAQYDGGDRGGADGTLTLAYSDRGRINRYELPLSSSGADILLPDASDLTATPPDIQRGWCTTFFNNSGKILEIGVTNTNVGIYLAGDSTRYSDSDTIKLSPGGMINIKCISYVYDAHTHYLITGGGVYTFD